MGARRAVVDELTAALELAAQGVGPRTLVVTAGPGSGKTHTLAELASGYRAATRWSTADELSWRQPYAVASALVGVEPPASPPPDFGERLFEAIDTLCAHTPHLLVVDDAHNADAASLEVLGRAAAAARDLPLVILIARRHLPARELLTRLLARPLVAEWSLPRMDAIDLDALTRQVLGVWPDDELSQVLARSGGNPMHAIALLENHQVSGPPSSRDVAGSLLSAPGPDLSTSLGDTISGQLALLTDASRDVVDKLAVWGGPATVSDLAALGQMSPVDLVGPVRTAIDAGVIEMASDGALSFTHDVYADVAYGQMAPPLRAIVHSAVAQHHTDAGNNQMVAHHLMAAGADDAEVLDAVTRARGQLDHAPSVAADLLDSAVQRASEKSPASPIELDLATALARSGQLERAAQVASENLPKATDTSIAEKFHHLLIFTLINRAGSAQVHAIVTATLQLPIDARTREQLRAIGHYVDLMEGTTPVPRQPFPMSQDGPIIGMEAEALRRFLSGDVSTGLQIALQASQAAGVTSEDGIDLNRAIEIWPPLLEQYLHGPAAAEALMDRALQQRNERDIPWLSSYLDFVRGMIDLARGRLDDAAATLDDALDVASDAGLRWTSLGEGSRALIAVYRSDFSFAATRLDTLTTSGRPNLLGIPLAERVEALLLETQRKLRPAADTAQRCWNHAAGLGLYGWLPTFALDCARIATRSGHKPLIHDIAAVLANLPLPVAEAGAPQVDLATALCSGSIDAVLTAATHAATDAHTRGDALVESASWEEAACAAAASGDKQSARDYARAALVLTQTMGATGLSARIISRLRQHGIRMDASTIRERPRFGWESLTRTEVTVVELVASGLSGGEIAERLFISTRTVQTHVSRALRKLGLRTRVELAAYIAGGRSAAPQR